MHDVRLPWHWRTLPLPVKAIRYNSDAALLGMFGSLAFGGVDNLLRVHLFSCFRAKCSSGASWVLRSDDKGIQLGLRACLRDDEHAVLAVRDGGNRAAQSDVELRCQRIHDGAVPGRYHAMRPAEPAPDLLILPFQ